MKATFKLQVEIPGGRVTRVMRVDLTFEPGESITSDDLKTLVARAIVMDKIANGDHMPDVETITPVPHTAGRKG